MGWTTVLVQQTIGFGLGETAQRRWKRKIGPALLMAFAIGCDHSPDALLIITEPQPPAPTTAGSFQLDAACATILESSSGGLYTFSKPSILTLKVDSRKTDGTVVWSKTLPSDNNACKAAVSASNSVVVVASDSIFSLDGQTGAIRWRFAARNTWGIATSSTGKIFVSVPLKLYALSDADGTVQWSQVVDDPGAPFVDDARSTVYEARRAGAQAFEIATGNTKWQTLIGSDLTLDAAIASDGTILVSRANDFSGEITAYGTDGTRIWRNAALTPRQPVGSPVIDDAGTVYTAAFNNSFQGGVYAFSATTGATKWTHDFYRIHSNVAVDSTRTVYVIAQATADSVDRLYGLRDGAIVSAVSAASGGGMITIHSNHLLYYAANQQVWFVPTAGVSSRAAWPVDKHDAKRSARRQ